MWPCCLQLWQCLPRDRTKHFHYERERQPCGDSSITLTKWSRGHDILSCSHELICRGHDKTSLSELNISPPGRSKCFVRLFGDHLLFPVDDLWPTFCMVWISALWILNLNLMFRISSSSWKLEAVFLKTGYLQSKNSEQKYAVWKYMSS